MERQSSPPRLSSGCGRPDLGREEVDEHEERNGIVKLSGRADECCNVPASVGPVTIGGGDPGLPHPYVRTDLAAAGPDEGDEV